MLEAIEAIEKERIIRDYLETVPSKPAEKPFRQIFEPEVKDGSPHKKLYSSAPAVSDDSNTVKGNIHEWSDIIAVAAGSYKQTLLDYVLGLKKDGTVLTIGNNGKPTRVIGNVPEDIVSLYAGDYYSAAITAGGKAVPLSKAANSDQIEKWDNIKLLSGFENKIAGLKRDGTFIYSSNIPMWVPSPKSIVNAASVALTSKHISILSADGKVKIYEGLMISPDLHTDDWENIISIAAGPSFLAGLKPDVTVKFTGTIRNQKIDIGSWSDITAVSAGNTHIVGLKSDGTVLAYGDNTYGKCNVSDWTDIKAIAAGKNHTVGLRSDGTVVAAGKAFG